MSESVTVIIPAWNRPRRLLRAICSVLEQDYPGLALIVVDDASDCDLDAARTLVEKSGHTWLRLDQNGGPAAARNAGAGKTDSRWITFLDSDDLWLPGKLSRQIEWHLANSEYRISQVTENWIRNGAEVRKPVHLQQVGGEIFDRCLAHCAIGPSCVMIRRDLWEESGGFDPWFRVCEDYELWLRISVFEKVGLVDGPPLVEKNGGYHDQLSTLVPALDRFRLVALARLLEGAWPLADEEKAAVLAELKKRARILSSGAQKRGKAEWREFYEGCQFPLSSADMAIARRFAEETIL